MVWHDRARPSQRLFNINARNLFCGHHRVTGLIGDDCLAAAADHDGLGGNTFENRGRNLIHLRQRLVGHPREHFRKFDGKRLFMGKHNEKAERLVAPVLDPMEEPLRHEGNIARFEFEIVCFPFGTYDPNDPATLRPLMQ